MAASRVAVRTFERGQWERPLAAGRAPWIRVLVPGDRRARMPVPVFNEARALRLTRPASGAGQDRPSVPSQRAVPR